MTDKRIKKSSEQVKPAKKSAGYTYPKGNIRHSGSYGINESDSSIRIFERGDQNHARNEERRRARKEALRRRKRRRRIALITAACLVLVAAGGIFAFQILKEPADTSDVDDQVVPVAAPPAEEPEAASPEETQATTETAEPEVDSSQDYDASYTRVINRSYPIPAGFIAGTGQLVTVEGKQMETKAGEALQQMVADLRATGMNIIIQSGYRTDADQEYLYNRQINRQGGNELKAATISAVPLTSEHQAGLAVDLSTDGTLEESFAYTDQGKWLKANCANYGYILRYPSGKETVTGIISEPWHFRYVGDPATAQKIMASGKCMEEYYGKTLKDDDITPYLEYLQ
ncbi:MAG: D-alanyl-D-alanine carboxypeptidase family protein [Clostridia bacterium]